MRSEQQLQDWRSDSSLGVYRGRDRGEQVEVIAHVKRVAVQRIDILCYVWNQTGKNRKKQVFKAGLSAVGLER